ncbi:MAG TPA: amidohydrolase family protein [Pyrinomonadaceae bacterium]
MSDIKAFHLPTEVQLAFEVMPCQANRRVYEPAEKPHPCTYFAEWGVYHSFDYGAAGPKPLPELDQVNYVGKTYLLPEILSGCRKAPIMCVGINPNLPGFWEKTHSALNPVFDDFLQYAFYFRKRSTAKLQIPRETYDELLGEREDSYKIPDSLVDFGTKVPVEQSHLLMYKSYQELLEGLALKQGWTNHKLAIGEDLSYANMVACPSAKWIVTESQSDGGKLPVMGTERMRGIVGECFHERKYFLRQLFQSLPVVLFVFSATTAREFIAAMDGHFTQGDPKPNETLDALLSREIRLGYGKTSTGAELSARVIFSPHASANPNDFQKFKEKMVSILSEEVNAGRLAFNEQTGHLARPLGNCIFCSNSLYHILECEYKEELKPISPQEAPALMADVAPQQTGVAKENAEQARLLENFLNVKAARPKTGPTPSGADLLALDAEAESAETEEEAAAFLNVDELDSPPSILRGRVVTMDAGFSVIKKGSVYLKNGRIVAVSRQGEAIPAGFPTDAPVIETEGTIYPGLLDLHNHLAYNVASVWNVPKRFDNRSKWRSNSSYAANVTKPLKVLAGNTQTAKAIVRYVEVKALLGGTTATQGMRSTFTKTMPTSIYAGIVRNFEGTDDVSLPNAGTKISDLDPTDPNDIISFRNSLQSRQAYFYHLSEGIDAVTRQHFLNLKELDLLRPALIGIHALALNADDLAELHAAGGKIVWSPLSNLLLYGQTINPNALVQSGVPFALGCDWSPSGSKNLLEEMKVAWLVAQDAEANLTPRDLCAAVTRHAAEIASWGSALGSIENNKYADLIVIEGDDGDPYEKLLRATERDVRLVVINGYARTGDADVMNRFGFPAKQLEAVTVGGREKLLNLSRNNDPLGNLSFGRATDILKNSMSNLHEASLQASADAFALMSDEEPFQLLLDDEMEETDEFDAELTADVPLPESIPLDAPALIDDAAHFATLEKVAHLPVFLKRLADFYK